MKTFQVPLNEKLIARIEKTIKRAGTTRTAFVSKALLEAVQIREKERRHLEGYRKRPVTTGEFDIWEKEQAWGDP